MWLDAWWGAPLFAICGVVLMLVVGLAGVLAGRVLDWLGVAVVGAPFYVYGDLLMVHGAVLDLGPLAWPRSVAEHPMVAGAAVVLLGYSAFHGIHDVIQADRRRRHDQADLLERIRAGTL